MKHVFLLFVFVFSFLIVSANQLPDYTKIPAHPCLLLKSGEENKLKKNLRKNEPLHQVHLQIMRLSNTLLNEPVLSYKKEGYRLLDVSRSVQGRIFYLSYAYRMSGDKKYMLRAEKEMLAACAFQDWNPSHFLDVAEMTLGVSIGYDWLFNELSEETKEIVRTAIIEKAINPSNSNNNSYVWFLNVEHNWNQVCNTGLLFGALAVHDTHPQIARPLIERSLKSIEKSLNTYAPSGCYPEGYSYWGYGTSFQVLFIAAIESALANDFGLSTKPGFLETARFIEYMSAPSGLCFSYSDCDPPVTSKVMLYWFADKMKDPSILWIQKDMHDAAKPFLEDDRLLPCMIIFGSHFNLNKIPAPTQHIYSSDGVCPIMIIRTDWKRDKGMYLGIKGGKAITNHGHMDGGSFVFETDGVRWAYDLGMQDYYSIEKEGINIWDSKQGGQRWKVYRYNNFTHNTLTINNKEHKVDGFVPIVERYTSKDKQGALLDLSALFDDVKSVYRTIAIIEGKYLSIVDKIHADDKQANVSWNMVTAEDVKLVKSNMLEITKDGKKMHMIIDSPTTCDLKVNPAVSIYSYDAPNPGLVIVGFNTKIQAGQEIEFKVRLIPVK